MSKEFTHCTTFRVRFAEIDGQMVVFNSRYLEYADIALTDFLRSLDIPLQGPDAFELQVVKATVLYKRALRFDDVVQSWLKVQRIGRSSVVFEIEFRIEGTSDARASVELTYVHVDLAAEKSLEIPPEMRRKFLGENA